jgi:hypothetical protein
VGPLDIHVQRLRERHPAAQVRDVGGGLTLVSLAELILPTGWNKPATAVHFALPQGYPFAKPDCFWADEELRLASGAIPQNSNCGNAIPGIGQQGLWFSWHTDHWNASRDDLLTWLASIRERLSRVI